MRLPCNETGQSTAVKAEHCPDRQRGGLSDDLDEWLEAGRNIRRRKLLGPFGIASGFKFPFSDNAGNEEGCGSFRFTVKFSFTIELDKSACVSKPHFKGDIERRAA
jgi:hypothetical protein